MRVLIAGCGDLGTRLGLRLARQGHEVFGLRRDPSGLPAGIARVAADLGDPTSFGALPEAPDAIVYLAAADERSDAAYERAYVAGVRHLIAHTAASPPERFLFISSTAVYGQHQGEWVDEDSPTEPTAFSGRRLLEAEALVARQRRATALRLGGIYGPGRTRLVDRVRSGEARITAGPPRYTNRIHVDDAAAVCASLLSLEDPPPRLVGVDDAPAPEREVLTWLAERLGVPVPPEAEPAPGGRLRGQNKRCSNRRLRELGIALAHPSYREGYAGLLSAS